MVSRAIIGILTLATVLLVGWTLLGGWDYYGTSLAERPHHPDFREFRPAGSVGHGLGILGSAMILLLLLYSVRKRVRVLRRAGDLRTWLRYHIFLGIAGPVLITLHTSFKVDGLVAVSYWSMVAVALSGFFGRYLYQQIPRNVLGEAMSVDQIEATGEEILVDLSAAHGVDDKAVHRLEEIALGRLRHRSAGVALVMLPVLNLVLARQLQSWSVGFAGRRNPEAEHLARRWALQARRLHLFHLIRDLFHLMIVHVGVAVALGYTWTFGS